MNPDEHATHLREKVEQRLAEQRAAAEVAAQTAQQAPDDPAEAARQAQVRDDMWKRARAAVLARPAAPLPPTQQRERADQVRSFVEGENLRLQAGRTTTLATAAPAAPAVQAPASTPAAPAQPPLQRPDGSYTPAAFPSVSNAAKVQWAGPETEREHLKRVTSPESVKAGTWGQQRDAIIMNLAQAVGHQGVRQLPSAPGHAFALDGSLYTNVERPPGWQGKRISSGIPASVLEKRLGERQARKLLSRPNQPAK